mmetsp:Transcript_127551/g.271950  ORF Transcript_127551/g.271950 Transcript_127551/m.271950 type:complete len:453 (+) Transcript_127551:54-1412(+)
MPIADYDPQEYFLPDRIEKLLDAFSRFDMDGDGVISESELQAMFKKLGKPLTRQQLREVLREVDEDGNGNLDFEEFLVLEIKLSRMRPRADLINYRDYIDERSLRQLEQLFVQYDPFGRGTVGLTELNRMLEVLGCKASQEFKDEILAEMDKENISELEFDKFGAFWAIVAKRRKRINYREFLTAEEVEKYRAWFEQADEDGTQTITRPELDGILRRNGHVLSKQQLTALLKDFDSDGSGDIDFEEFVVMMLRLRCVKRQRVINPENCNCGDLWMNENFTIRELQQSGFGLQHFKQVGIPVGTIYSEGKVSALELRRAGYTSAELRRGGVSVSELRSSGFSLADLRNAGFSDGVLSQTNRLLRGTLSSGDLTALPQMRPHTTSFESCFNNKSMRGGFAQGQAFVPCPWQLPPRQMTPMIREHTDWRPRLNRSKNGKKKLVAAGAELAGLGSL